MSRTEVSITTPDGDARSFVFKPDQGSGPWPATIVYMDAPAIRPALFDLAQRLADNGYYVLLPDMFYRDGPYEPVTDVGALFADEEARKRIFAKMGKATGVESARSDTRAFLDFLAAQPEVSGAKVFVGGADQDQGFPPEQAERLRGALGAARVEHQVEIFEGARHGYVMTDLSVYDEAGAERHWRELVALFDSTLKAAA